MAFLADKPTTVSNPTCRYTSFEKPRIAVNNTAPNTPSGITKSTENGIDQLSYSAAKHKNTTKIEIAYKIGALPPDFCSSNANPVHSCPIPSGSCFIIASIAAIDSPVLFPGAEVPCSAILEKPLYRVKLGEPYCQRLVANEANEIISPLLLRTYHLAMSSGVARLSGLPCR